MSHIPGDDSIGPRSHRDGCREAVRADIVTLPAEFASELSGFCCVFDGYRQQYKTGEHPRIQIEKFRPLASVADGMNAQEGFVHVEGGRRQDLAVALEFF